MSAETIPTTTTESKLSRKASIKLANAAFDRLAFLDHCAWTNHREKCVALARDEEKRHRGSGDSFSRHHQGAASVADCARHFVVKRIAEYLLTPRDKWPTGRDLIHTQPSALYACGLADEFGDNIRKAWAGLDVSQLASLDYLVLVQA